MTPRLSSTLLLLLLLTACGLADIRPDSLRDQTALTDDQAQRGRALLAAMEQAIEAINSDKSKYSDLLSERSLVPEPLLGTYVIPDFPAASVPPQSQWDDVLAWAMEKGYVAAELQFEDSIDDSFLP